MLYLNLGKPLLRLNNIKHSAPPTATPTAVPAPPTAIPPIAIAQPTATATAAPPPAITDEPTGGGANIGIIAAIAIALIAAIGAAAYITMRQRGLLGGQAL